jgi:hypothetical protein
MLFHTLKPRHWRCAIVGPGQGKEGVMFNLSEVRSADYETNYTEAYGKSRQNS